MKKFFIGLLATILINSRIKKTKSLMSKSPKPPNIRKVTIGD